MSINAREFLEKEVGPMTFGKMIVAVRMLLDMTQTEFGEQMGLSRSMICDIEKGRILVSPSMAIRIAEMADFPAEFALKYCLADQLRKHHIEHYEVDVRKVA